MVDDIEAYTNAVLALREEDAEKEKLLDAAEAVHMVCQEKWGDTNGVTVDAKLIIEYFKKTTAANGEKP